MGQQTARECKYREPSANLSRIPQRFFDPVWWMESMTSKLYCMKAAACNGDNPSGSSLHNVWNYREPLRTEELLKLVSPALQHGLGSSPD